MILWTGHADERVRLSGLLGPPNGVLGELQMAWPGLKDISPCLGFGERDLVWRNAYYRPIFPVDLFDVMHNRASKKRPYKRDACGGPAAGAREVSQRMEVEVVNESIEGIL